MSQHAKLHRRITLGISRASIILAAALVAACSPAGGPPKPTGTAPEPPASQASPEPHWDYATEAGPARWGGLSPKYAQCGEGRSQSPIDIGTTQPADAPALKTAYRPTTLRIVHHSHKADVVNTGHSIQVNYPDADTLSVGDDSFTLLQYHFHSPSEHTVNGRHSPMEMHLVHRSAGGGLAVLGVLIEEGAQNAAFDPIWANLPSEKGMEKHLESVTVDVNQLLPQGRAVYRYTGSLTTPPCSEGVQWFLMTEPIALSAEQIGRFRDILAGNNRPVQPLNDRVVTIDGMR